MMFFKNDVCLLLDSIPNFINTFISTFCPNQLISYSTPSFTKKTGAIYTGEEMVYITKDQLRMLLKNIM